MTDRPTHPPTVPTELELPSPLDSDAPAIELHLPPNPPPDIREATTLIPSESDDHTDVETNGNFKEALENVIRAHEEKEAEKVAKLAALVEKVERDARAERQAMAEKLDHIVTVIDGITDLYRQMPELMKGAVSSLTDTFLERTDRLISDVASLRENLMAHELRIAKLERASSSKDKAP